MSDEMLKGFETEAAALKRRDLTQAEKRAIGDEMLKGILKPDMDRRKRKNVLRHAITQAGRQDA
ncbi:hypothetical protein ASG43_11900 [Aureimonas sp. Leaf454]|uniref:hypothetical protein n=1 Tax=Aureimonas sp. Leaf454 TaxID=1736381 RepID=UPI0006FC08E1|nr:hypothetical protein [Aureimonas sp. Leaf454]KQT46320.1 hypothetical protein ASG43_11900 [Aureimonas sp. Leaf454]